jgi:hypothetical protein
MNCDGEWSLYNCLAPVLQPVRAGFFGAMDATIDLSAGFNTMPYHPAITMRTGRRQHMNRTLEAVKGSSLSR